MSRGSHNNTIYLVTLVARIKGHVFECLSKADLYLYDLWHTHINSLIAECAFKCNYFPDEYKWVFSPNLI